MKTVGIVGNPRKDGLADTAGVILDWCARQGAGALVQDDIAGRMPGRGGVRAAPLDLVAAESDLVFSLGGDGTLLVAVRAIARAGREIPVFGVNLGSLGFLTQVGADELPGVLERSRVDGFIVRGRMMLEASVKRCGAAAVALNDIVIKNGAASRMLSFEARADGDLITRFAADGLILATPTGSTAYTLSAGGPIVMPGVEAIIATPICPHTLSIRACVIPPGAVVEIEMLSCDDDTLVSADGDKFCGVAAGDTVVVRRAPCEAKLVEIGEHPYYEILGRKLRWSGRVIER
jgi:NAD+ kinase